MGIGGISMWQLLILLLIVVMVFGTKKLRNLGGDLGAAVKGFRKGMEDDKGEEPEKLEAEALGADSGPSPSGSDTAEDTAAKNDSARSA